MSILNRLVKPVTLLLAMFLLTSATYAQSVSIPDVQLTLIDNVRVPARQPGAVAQLHVREGEIVAKNQSLLQMDTESAELQCRAAELASQIAELEMDNDVDKRYAEKSLAVSAAQLQRARQAVTAFAKSISKSEMEELKLVVDRSQLAIEQAARKLDAADLNHRLKMAELKVVAERIDEMDVPSPLNGMVVELPVREGEWVSPGDVVARVIRLDRLRIEAFVDGKKYDQTMVGKSATLTITIAGASEPQEFPAIIVYISPEVQPITGQVRIWAEVENKDLLLRPGMTGTLNL